jgi:hypothetical protein
MKLSRAVPGPPRKESKMEHLTMEAFADAGNNSTLGEARMFRVLPDEELDVVSGALSLNFTKIEWHSVGMGS